MADGDYERREPKTAELKRLERVIAEARQAKEGERGAGRKILV